MLTLADILQPRHVDLSLGTVDPGQGLDRLARLLQDDPGIMDWEPFHAALKLGGKPVGTHSLLSHLRTERVSTMLMAAGRIPSGETVPSTPLDGSSDDTVYFLFLIAVPMTLAADYLRIVGALARSLRNPAIIAALRETASAADFVHILCAEAEEM